MPRMIGPFGGIELERQQVEQTLANRDHVIQQDEKE